MRTLSKVTLAVLVVFILTSSTLIAQSSSTEEEIIALTYKLWNAENEKDMDFRDAHISDEYTEFNPSYSTRIEGKSKNFKLMDANGTGTTSLADEMLNPKVQVYGDVAILTYNFAGVMKESDGEVTNVKAKSTRVYAKMGGTWKLVHANFALDPNGE